MRVRLHTRCLQILTTPFPRATRCRCYRLRPPLQRLVPCLHRTIVTRCPRWRVQDPPPQHPPQRTPQTTPERAPVVVLHHQRRPLRLRHPTHHRRRTRRRLVRHRLPRQLHPAPQVPHRQDPRTYRIDHIRRLDEVHRPHAPRTRPTQRTRHFPVPPPPQRLDPREQIRQLRHGHRRETHPQCRQTCPAAHLHQPRQHRLTLATIGTHHRPAPRRRLRPAARPPPQRPAAEAQRPRRRRRTQPR